MRDIQADQRAARGRIRCIDWMRGLSVLFMIECHCLYFLRPEHSSEPVYHTLQQLNGLLAPTFILTAGFSLALVSGRAMDPAARRQRILKTLRRIGEVFLVAIALKTVYWRVFFNPERLLWVNVLECIALSLLLIMPILFFVPLKSAVLSVIGLALFLAAPFVQGKDYGVLTGLINNSLYGDTWPLVPWAGYAFIGAIIGLRLSRSRDIKSLLLGFTWLIIVGLPLAAFPKMVDWVFGTTDAWMIVNAGERLWRIGTAGMLLLGLEKVAQSHRIIIENPAIRLIELFSRQSLAAYALHLAILFGVWKFQPFNRFHTKCDWPLYIVLTICVATCTMLACVAIERVFRMNANRQQVRSSALEPVG